MTAVALGLAAGLLWGTSDFLGGLAARRAAVASVVVTAQVAGVLAVLLGIVLAGEPWPGAAPFGTAMAGGLAAAVGIVAFYRALGDGTMGVVAPLAATGVVIPIVVGLASGDRPGAPVAAGAGLALAGVLVAARGPGTGGGGGVGMALLAGAGFGTFYVFLDRAAEHGALWAVAGARASSIPLVAGVALGAGISVRPPTSGLPVVVAAGLIDAVAVLAFAAASARGLLSVVAVLGSLYPVVTAAIAAAVLRERLTRVQWAGSALAMGGILLIAAGR